MAEEKELLQELKEVVDVDLISTLKLTSPSRILQGIEQIQIEEYSAEQWADAYDFLIGMKPSMKSRKEIVKGLVEFYLMLCRQVLNIKINKTERDSK